MPNTYTWIIESLDCMPSTNGQTNVVSNVHWRVNAISDQTYATKLMDGTTQTLPYSSTVYGTQQLTYTSESPFTEYIELTLETVIDWIQTAMGAEQITAIQNDLDKKIDNLVNPLIVSPKLPWA